MLNQPRKLTLPRVTAAPTATSSAYVFNTPVSSAAQNVLLFVFPYMAWMLAESLELSGIVAILFCGFGMAHYTALSLSKETEARQTLLPPPILPKLSVLTRACFWCLGASIRVLTSPRV